MSTKEPDPLRDEAMRQLSRETVVIVGDDGKPVAVLTTNPAVVRAAELSGLVAVDLPNMFKR